MKDMKAFKNAYSLMAVTDIIFGIVLLIWPDVSMKTFCYVLGVMSVIFGLVHIIIYFTRDKMQAMLQMDMVSGICLLAFGIFVLVKPEFIISILPFVVGVIMLLGAVVKFQNCLDMKKLGFTKWYLILVASLLMVGVVIILVINPFEAAEVMMILLGAGLLADGLISLFDIFMLNSLVKKAKKAASEAEAAIITEEPGRKS